jgi:hypothetical protein
VPVEAPPPPEEIPEEVLLSERNDHLDELFVARDEEVIEDDRPIAAVVAEQTAKQVIMQQLQEKRGGGTRPVKLGVCTGGDGLVMGLPEIPEGRKKLIGAVEQASDLSAQVDSLTLARKALATESALKKAALERCFGARPFRDYLARKRVHIPEPLASIGRAPQPRPASVKLTKLN